MTRVCFFAVPRCFLLLIFINVGLGTSLSWAQELTPTTEIQKETKQSAAEFCEKELSAFPGPFQIGTLKKACQQVKTLNECTSVLMKPIFHFDRDGDGSKDGKKILVFSLIHGDETHAGSIGRFWMERLSEIAPRNSWRVVPILNPDGYHLRTRTNANKTDLNRNFPTKDWDADAIKYWQKQTSSNPRRFPGPSSASEPETNCAMAHIQDFQPEFIVSVHTPLNVLDYDGPKVKPPAYDYLPWRSLGHFPGSLGRYMWFERSTPVLTMELKASLPSSFKTFEKLQDVIGTLVKLEIRK